MTPVADAEEDNNWCDGILFCPRHFWNVEMLRQTVQVFVELFHTLFMGL